MDKKERYEKIVTQLIKESYPLLRNKRVKIKLANKFESYILPFSARAEWGFSLVIRINPKYDIYNNFELRGLLAHELIHLEDFVRFGRLRFFIHQFKVFSNKFNRLYERQTDKRVICEKGYRKELLACKQKRERHKDRNYKKLKRNYLTSREIKSLKIREIKVIY